MTVALRLIRNLELRVEGFRDPSTLLAKRLLSMGIRPGSLLKIANIAPLGDPIEIKAFGHNIALRRSELEEMILTPATPSTAPAEK